MASWNTFAALAIALSAARGRHSSSDGTGQIPWASGPGPVRVTGLLVCPAPATTSPNRVQLKPQHQAHALLPDDFTWSSRKKKKGRERKKVGEGGECLYTSPVGINPSSDSYVATLAGQGLVLYSHGPAPPTGSSPEGLLLRADESKAH